MNELPDAEAANATGATGHPYTDLPDGKVHCARCAAIVDAGRADYTETGEMVCARCAASRDLEETEGRAVIAMKAVGYGNIAVGLLSWLVNPFFLLTLASLGNASYVVNALTSSDWYRRRMGSDYGQVMFVAVLGGIAGAVPIAILLLQIFGLL